MICVFPDPYPDELLYSACARYHDLMQYPNSATAACDFFGDGVIAVVDLPNRLEHLIAALPPGHLYTVDEFINGHTMLPFYAPFLSRERARIVREEMRGDGENRVSARIGIKASFRARPTRLRFCPTCVAEDRRRFGETYWHRLHQMPGVDVCHSHAAFLEASGASCGRRAFVEMMVSAESALEDRPVRPLDLSNSVHKLLLDIARNAAWLLEWEGGKAGNDDLRERYYSHLLSRGLAYYNGKIRVDELVGQFCEHYPPQVLKALDCEINNKYFNWLLRLLHSSLAGVSQLPVRHILLILFLGLTAEEFFTSYEEFKPFGVGPWPCLNRAAEHFGEAIISECRITDNLVRGKRGRPVGTFSCRCGFAYNRVGPDASDADRTRINSVESYGPTWEEILREGWSDISIPVGEVARRLGVSDLTVVRYAIRLNLPMNVRGARRVSLKTIERYKNFRRSRSEALEYYRKEWLAVLKANPDASRNELIKAASFLYLWLNKNDRQWLESNLPLVRIGVRRSDLKDWEAIDIELAEAVEASAKRIRESPGRPRRVCLSKLVKKIGHKVHFEQRLDKLPYTAKALGLCIESLEAYMVRKVAWAEESYKQEGRCPTRHQLMGRAGIINSTGNKELVQLEVDAAIARLQEALTIRATSLAVG